jgi:glycogen operon protein
VPEVIRLLRGLARALAPWAAEKPAARGERMTVALTEPVTIVQDVLPDLRGPAPAPPPEANGAARTALRLTRGRCRPFGATPGPDGVNFAVFARHAAGVHLLLFKEGREEPTAEIVLDPKTHRTGDVWHVFIHGLGPDVLYGYRVFGPMTPRAGHRYDPRTVLLDPYAPAVSGGARWGHPDVPHGQPGARLTRRSRTEPADDFDWEDDAPPNTPPAQTVLYELHVRGYTRHPSSGVRHPGTFLGLVEKIPHLRSLGVTAVQLMPVLEFDELDHARRHPTTGEVLRNYWGYAPLSFFAPKASYAAHAGRQVRELKELVKALHKAGIEVILDVVYNHTAEGNEHGPTLSFRGLDNAIFYMLDREGRYYNYSGCGNTFNCNHPVVRDLILDSLTYLVSELHVDGFRFDLASVMARGPDGRVLEGPPLLQHIAEHPVLAHTKLIAEAWDAAGLMQLGKFPAWGRWAELNGWFRDDVRRFVRGDPGSTSALAKRICGSVDLYGDSAKHPYHSVNFVTCHDGFTLADLVSHDRKHNEANGEHNRDGWDHNFSWNCGIEGPTEIGTVNALRQRQMRNFLTLTLISQGVPLLLQGDELGRTQRGNNNAYCQDNDISWVDWGLEQKNAGLLRFTRLMVGLRKRHFALSREQFIGRVTWHGPKLGEPDWAGQQRALAFHLHGGQGRPDLYVFFNAHWEQQRFALPPVEGRYRWQRLIDTNLPAPDDAVEEKDAVPLRPADHYMAAPRSAVILLAPR